MLKTDIVLILFFFSLTYLRISGSRGRQFNCVKSPQEAWSKNFYLGSHRKAFGWNTGDGITERRWKTLSLVDSYKNMAYHCFLHGLYA